jgi:phosphoadenosine phosphosulfate reductase
MPLYKDGHFIENIWRSISEGEDIPPSGHVIVPLDWWRAERAAFEGSHVPLGLFIEPDAPLATITEDLHRFQLIAIHFPKFGDGRGYSLARLLRQRYGFAGELRACGDVLIDQIQVMSRCGINAFDINDAATEQALRQGHLTALHHFYQPGAGHEIPEGTRHWARRSL